MRLRNGEDGYGLITRALHWLTVVAIVAQFTVGWTMDADAPADLADDRVDAFEEGGEERAEAEGEAAEEEFEAEVERREAALDDDALSGVLGDLVNGSGFRDGLQGIEVHLLVGMLVALLGLARLIWRRTTPLPPWAPHLSDRERTVEAWLEKALLGLMLLVPGTGLVLLVGSDDLLAVHVAAQVTLLAVVAGHVSLVLRHTVVRRNRHLARML